MPTGNEKPLLLGGGQIRVAGRFAGNVTGCYVDKAVNKATHQTNFGLEFRTDHVLAISSAYNLGFTMMDINPENANLMLGAPGFNAVPTDRSLPGERRDLTLLNYGQNRMQYVEETKLKLDIDGKAVWSPLIYPIAAANAGALASPIISVTNQAFSGAVGSYLAYCFAVRNTGAASTQSLPSNIEFTPFTAGAPGHEALLGALVPPQGTTYINTDEFSIYQATVTRDPVTQEWDFSGGSGMELVDVAVPAGTDTGFDWVALGVPVAGSPNNGWLIDGDSTSGTFYGVDWYGDTMTTSTAIPPSMVPITVKTYDPISTPSVPLYVTMTWLVDFMYEQNRYAGGSVKTTYGSRILHADTCNISYYYDAAQVREMPLIGMGQNPIIPMTLEIVYPDNRSKMIWHFFKVQINTNMRLATNENDWMGVDFTGETLDASDIYPRYGFGYVQFTGPIIDLIKEFGNIPFGNTEALSLNQTSFG